MERKSILEKQLEFKSGIHLVKIILCGFSSNFRWHDYVLHVDDGKGIGEMSFNQYCGIVDYRYFEHNGCYGTINLSKFKERFQEVIKKLVPKSIYQKYISAMDMGQEGIFPLSDDKETLKELFSLDDLKLSYLER